MTTVPRNVRPSISPMSANKGVAEATPVIVPDELEEGREGQDRDPVHDDHEPPEAHSEVRAPRVARRPNLPTKAGIEEHYPLHSTTGVDVCTVWRAKRELPNTSYSQVTVRDWE